MKIRIMLRGLLVALGIIFGVMPALAQKSGVTCDQATKEVKILEDLKTKYETQEATHQKNIDDDRRNGRPVRQEDLDAVADLKDRIKGVDERIKQAQGKADATCKKEKEACTQKKGMTWCANENHCVSTEYALQGTCKCGCGETR